jgi:hypothetical protein
MNRFRYDYQVQSPRSVADAKPPQALRKYERNVALDTGSSFGSEVHRAAETRPFSVFSDARQVLCVLAGRADSHHGLLDFNSDDAKPDVIVTSLRLEPHSKR